MDGDHGIDPGPGEPDVAVAPSTSSVVAAFAFLGLLAVAIGAVAWATRPPARRELHPQRVAVIGDSITSQAAPELRQTLSPLYDLSVTATPGRTFESELADARAALARHPDQVVVNLGSNDVLNRVPWETTRAAMAQLFDAIAPGTCVHVVTVNERFYSTEADQRTRAEQINDELFRIAAARGYHFIDWSALVIEAYDAGEPDGRLFTDSVHPSAVGQRKLAEAYRASLAECVPAASTPSTAG